MTREAELLMKNDGEAAFLLADLIYYFG